MEWIGCWITTISTETICGDRKVIAGGDGVGGDHGNCRGYGRYYGIPWGWKPSPFTFSSESVDKYSDTGSHSNFPKHCSQYILECFGTEHEYRFSPRKWYKTKMTFFTIKIVSSLICWYSFFFSLSILSSHDSIGSFPEKLVLWKFERHSIVCLSHLIDWVCLSVSYVLCSLFAFNFL